MDVGPAALSVAPAKLDATTLITLSGLTLTVKPVTPALTSGAASATAAARPDPAWLGAKGSCGLRRGSRACNFVRTL